MTPAPPAPQAPKKNGLPVVVIILLALGVGCVPITGILAAIAIPNFIRFQARAKQGECKASLRAIYAGERAAFLDGKKYVTTFKEVGFSPIGPNQRYSYFLGPDEVLAATAPGALSAQQAATLLAVNGVVPNVAATGFTAACVGNIDRDEGQDIWSISSDDRTGRDGKPVPAGTPHQEVDDLER